MQGVSVMEKEGMNGKEASTPYKGKSTEDREKVEKNRGR